MVDSSSSIGKGKKRSISLATGGSKRFVYYLKDALDVAAQGVVPRNTLRVNEWAKKILDCWVQFRATMEDPSEAVPCDLLSCNDPQVLSEWLSKFVMEVRQESGEPYPPRSVQSILSGLYRISRENGILCNFLDKKDSRFSYLHKTLDTLCSKLHSDGVGATVHSAPVITVEDEQLLLDGGVLSMDNPTSLLHMVFYFVSLHCCLRGGQEQRDLSVSQFVRIPADVSQYDANTYYEYTEFISKNNLHRFKDIHSKNKVVRIYAVTDSGKCLVRLLDFYFNKLPPDPKAFYLRPLVKFSLELGKPWYSNVPIGINTLRNMMKKISEKGGLSNVYTNHSLRATATTRLFLSDVPEKVIQEKTGHRSLAGLRAYENTSSDQLKGMAKMLDSATSFQTPCIKDENADPDKVPEKKPEKPDDNPPKKLRMADDTPLKPKQMAQVFSGSLENCVINFYNNSDSK